MAVTIEDLYKQKSEVDVMSFECTEAHKRLKIIRGYYATFLYASSLFDNPHSNGHVLKKYDYPPNPTERTPKYGSHQKIYMSLQRSKIRVLVDLGVDLERYHELRKKAEYHIGLDITVEEIDFAESSFKQNKERIDFYIKNGDQHFTKSKKVIEVKVNSTGKNQISKLKFYK
ncbi:hypothetical protein [Psychrobacter sp. PAMC 21119]|uniref:hypothetical protein n=1 Tax=Psychrobacter sp. PAMC 21119 TaxID=1112209 RepID=UPI0002883439|nr:hypothetical protein [Psychrobacter sp. PAMC 21119]